MRWKAARRSSRGARPVLAGGKLHCRPGQASVASADPGPICGRPPWHKRLGGLDRIACIHMSGLLMRSIWTAGQDGFRDASSNQPRDLGSADGSHGMSRTLDRSILPSTPLAAPVSAGRTSPIGRSVRRQPRMQPASARRRNSLSSSSASRRYGHSCWRAPRRQVWVACASAAPPARATDDRGRTWPA